MSDCSSTTRGSPQLQHDFPRNWCLETVFEAIADASLLFNAQHQVVFYNAVARSLMSLESFPSFQTWSGTEWIKHFHLRDDRGEELSLEQLPLTRVLNGETLQGANAPDVWTTLPSGNDILLCVSGAPIYTARGELDGAVLTLRDVTARREQERRTARALDVLVQMAEAMVQFPDWVRQSENEPAAYLRHSAERLLHLTCSLLDCPVGKIMMIRPDNKFEPVALAGLSPEDSERFRKQFKPIDLDVFLAAAQREVILHEDTVLIDMTAVPDATFPIYGVYKVLAAPICISGKVTGMLELNYGSGPHAFPLEQESMLIGTIARLIGLVIERERLLRERIQAQASELALREANRRMDEFLSMTSHELRNPLTTIKGSIQMVRRLFRRRAHELPLTTLLERADELLTRADRQVEAEVRLVNDLLDVSHIQSNKFDLHVQLLDLLKVVREVMVDFQTSEQQRRFVLSLPENELPMVDGDASRLSQVLNNFLTNAVRYSPEDRPIYVDMQISFPSVRVSVRDEGPGLTDQEKQQIWDRFFQGNARARSPGSSGLGLGLYICQRIIQQHRGDIGVESEFGKGSTFWFSLPLSSTNAQPIDAFSRMH